MPNNTFAYGRRMENGDFCSDISFLALSYGLRELSELSGLGTQDSGLIRTLNRLKCIDNGRRQPMSGDGGLGLEKAFREWPSCILISSFFFVREKLVRKKASHMFYSLAGHG